MSSLRYLFINDEGQVFGSANEPTGQDFEFAAVGMLTIVRLSDRRYYAGRGEWCSIPPVQGGTANDEGEAARLS
jgi:hypothetical protein